MPISWAQKLLKRLDNAGDFIVILGLLETSN